MTILLILIIIMSVRHAFEPDHIAALLTISSQSHSLTSVAKQGAIWGFGHSITLFIFSVILVGLQIEINESVFIILECLVGLVLIFMGITVIKNHKITTTNKYNDSKWMTVQKNKLSLKAFFIGLLHGAAGSGVIITIITSKIESISLKFTYIAVFSLFLIISMALLSVLMSMPLKRKIKLFPIRYLNIGIGTIAVLIGIKMLYEFSIQMNMLYLI
jgi:threonine/homoserine/homoserine lactone efflux protein